MQALKNDRYIVDRQLHLFVVALIGLGNQLVDFAVGDLCENAIALTDRQQDRVQHVVDSTNNLRIGSFELLRLAAIRELTFARGFGQAQELLLQALKNDADIVDSDLHLLVVAFVCLCNQLIDFAVGDLGQNAVALGNRQQNGIEHLIDALHHLALHTRKLVYFGSFAQMPFPRCF